MVFSLLILVSDLNIPIGIMPIKGGAVGYSIPYIYKFTDSNSDGKADKREVLYGEFEHKDPSEQFNRAEDHPEIVAGLKEKMQNFKIEGAKLRFQ